MDTVNGMFNLIANKSIESNKVSIAAQLTHFIPRTKNVGENEQAPILSMGYYKFTQSNAIFRIFQTNHSAKKYLGNTLFDQGLIDRWTDFSMNELERPYNSLLKLPKESPNYETTLKDIKQHVDIINNELEGKKFMLGDNFTFADVPLFCVCLPLFSNTLSKEESDLYPNIKRWLKECSNITEIKTVVGTTPFSD